VPTTAATRRRDTGLVGGVLALGLVLSGVWFAAGNPSAPDSGLRQIDLLMLSERVPGVDAVDGRPTVVVAAGQCTGPPPEHRTLADRFRVVVTTDPGLARRLALPRAAVGCEPGYALLAGDGTVRYRTYDPGWADHAFEQGVLLKAIAEGHP
jgi:hypothetical protein